MSPPSRRGFNQLNNKLISPCFEEIANLWEIVHLHLIVYLILVFIIAILTEEMTQNYSCQFRDVVEGPDVRPRTLQRLGKGPGRMEWSLTAFLSASQIGSLILHLKIIEWAGSLVRIENVWLACLPISKAPRGTSGEFLPARSTLIGRQGGGRYIIL